MTLGSTWPLTEMSKGGRCAGLTVMKSGRLNFLEPPWPVQACNAIPAAVPPLVFL
jgi:hypothetical protein